MSELAMISLLVGLIALLGGGLTLANPVRVCAELQAFPRSRWPGRILATIDLIWAAYELSKMHFGSFDAWKPHLYWLTPIAIFLCIKYLDELLSPRALGGLLLLAAGPALGIARWHPSNARLVISVLAYLWIIIGLLFLLSPWWFRRIASRLTGYGDRVVRISGALNVAIGLGFIALALRVY